ncbi:uncharacterized protein [Palaemon carinicauda]|uniref:uncharacterized protein n=1 Tax=Palaemon carinicauda TaxID=392227 RepID=UPI0035B59943
MNRITDALSRNTLAAFPLRLDYNTLGEAQRKDPEYQACRTSSTFLRWEDIPPTTPTSPSSMMSVLVDCELGILLPCADRWYHFHLSIVDINANLLGITLHQTSTYNPDADGMVERFHRTLKPALMSRCKDSNWFTQLPWVLLGLRTTHKDALGVSAAEIVYGDLSVVPAEFSIPATSLCENLVHATRLTSPQRGIT